MKTLDLHGIMHDEVERVVENFLLLHETPLEIITGNSIMMREIVLAVVEKHNFKYHYKSYTNLGAIIVI